MCPSLRTDIQELSPLMSQPQHWEDLGAEMREGSLVTYSLPPAPEQLARSSSCSSKHHPAHLLERHLQHPNHPGIQSTSTAQPSDASHLAHTFARCSATDSEQGPGRGGTGGGGSPQQGIWHQKGISAKAQHPSFVVLCTSLSTPKVLPVSEQDGTSKMISCAKQPRCHASVHAIGKTEGKSST